MYVLERIKCGGKIETETSVNKDELLKKLTECHPYDTLQKIDMPNIIGMLVISVHPQRSEGRYLYELPDVKFSA